MASSSTTPPVFTITYWGTTGTLSAPLKPDEVTEKLVRAIHALLEQDKLADLARGPDAQAKIRRCLTDHLPFYLRSTYGGNTTCLEVQTPDALLVLDCGSGLRELGIALERRWNDPGYSGSREAHVLLSHPHMDHTFGTPYLDSYFDPRNSFTLYSSAAVRSSLDAVLSSSSPLCQIYFPPTFDYLKAIRGFKEIEAGGSFSIGSTRITTLALRHPGGCLGFRLENAGRAFVFATDHEIVEAPDPALAAFAAGADLLYINGQYLAAEYRGQQGIMGEAPLSRVGWGHSSVEACVATAVAARVARLHVGHREPKRNDEDIARVERLIQELLGEELRRAGQDAADCRAIIPYEGLTVLL